MIKTFINLLLLLLICWNTQAQNVEPLHIQIISEYNSSNAGIDDFKQKIKSEIQNLLVNRNKVTFDSYYCSCKEPKKLTQLFDAAYNDSKTDIIIAVGPLASSIMGRRSTFQKPSIAGLIIDQKNQQVPITSKGNSGVQNFTYVQSPFSLEKDLNLLYEIYPFKNVGIITPADITAIFPDFDKLFGQSVNKLNSSFTKINAQNTAAPTLEQIPNDVDAIYLFPLFNTMIEEEYKSLIDGIITKQLPSVAMLGERIVDIGALAGYQSEPNIAKLPRRIALNVYKIVTDGINASELPVKINTYSDNVVINMSTVRKVGVYPNWDMVSEAILLNANEPTNERTLSLQTAIMEALKQNLDLKIAQSNPLIAGKEVDLAKAQLRPQLDLNSSVYALDEHTAGNSFGTRGRYNWGAGSSLSQLLYAEPALANVAIQKLLQKGETSGLKASQLDVILDATQAFLQVLQAKRFMEIQGANIMVTKSNLDISQAKDSVGYSGATDLNRWISELAIDKIDLNDAQTQYRQAKYAMNEVLNAPISEDFFAEDIDLNNQLLLATDARLISRINNESDLNKLSDFFVQEAMANLPELQQIDYAIAAQDRLLLSQKRAFYLPSFAVSGEASQTLKRWDVEEIAGIGIPDSKLAWNVGVGMQFPIFQGGTRRYNQEKTKLSILQIKDQRADIRNNLELRVRATVQAAAASSFEIQQFQKANQAANENFNIVQDAYTQGVISITNLIDAQNAKVQTEIGVANATYQFILDFFELERAIGYYYNLNTPSEQDAFFKRLDSFMTQE